MAERPGCDGLVSPSHLATAETELIPSQPTSTFARRVEPLARWSILAPSSMDTILEE